MLCSALPCPALCPHTVQLGGAELDAAEEAVQAKRKTGGDNKRRGDQDRPPRHMPMPAGMCLHRIHRIGHPPLCGTT